jgi:hypothetical protein
MSDVKELMSKYFNVSEDSPEVVRAERDTEEKNIESINAQIEELEVKLQDAKQRKTEMMREDHKPGEDHEYDYEGSMAKTQLCQIHQAATKLMKDMDDNENLPEWVQSKIAVACDYMIKVASYLDATDEQQDKSVDIEKSDMSSSMHSKKIVPFSPKPIRVGHKMMGFGMMGDDSSSADYNDEY